jgi:peptide methionine sulfoxide reductase msrA/msrB
MFTLRRILIALGIFIVIVGGVLWWLNTQAAETQRAVESKLSAQQATNTAEMIVAGGCFWCVEADMEKAPGVVSVVSGYGGGDTSNPTYENYAQGGHREVVQVTYDKDDVTYRQLLYYFLKHIDPTDGQGSFVDRGVQYSPAIYYQNDAQKQTAGNALKTIAESGDFQEKLRVPVLPEPKFWRAETYHQDYYRKNPVRYQTYRRYSGRDGFIQDVWGDTADNIPDRQSGLDTNSNTTTTMSNTNKKPWRDYKKPDQDELKANLTQEVFAVTQEDGTEPAYQNELWDEKREGIYVDVLSGEPLFSSKNKYESGTGWPSFTKPLEAENIVTEADHLLGYRRTEVRSRYGDNHLGHVFDDGPETEEAADGAEPTGLRYCLNSSALEFIPKDEMAERGYADYLSLFSDDE